MKKSWFILIAVVIVFGAWVVSGSKLGKHC